MAYTQQEINYLEQIQAQLDVEKTRNAQLQSDQTLSSFPQEGNANLVEFQLNLTQELDRIYHLLSGHVLTRDKEGSEIWVEPIDDRLKIFSEYGVKQLMNIISFYINKNTLLSNYDEETIKWKVRDFGIELADLIMTRYEAFFYFPSPEELFEKYKPMINKVSLNITEDELYYKCVQWSKEELQNKIRHYPIICISLIDSVHSTYLRAYKGMERESLRKQTSIMQRTDGNTMPQQYQQPQRFKLFSPKSWSK